MGLTAFWPTLIVLLIATAVDLRSRRVPNWLTAPFLAAGVVVSGLLAGREGIWRSLAGIGIAAGLAGLLCYLRGMGLGDLKLFAAVGAWIGPSQLISALVATAIAGGLLAIAWGLWNRSLGRHLDAVGELARFWRRGLRPHPALQLSNPAAVKMPYAAAIAAGTMFSFFTL